MSKSPNHYNGRNGWKPDMICCHVTEGGFNGAVSWLCNPAAEASSHFVVGAKGQKEQLVDFANGAWCNGNTTNASSRLYYKNATNPIVRSRAANANYYTYSIEHEGYSYKDRYGALTEAQYQASLSVMKLMIVDMKNTYGITFQADREHLIGHFEIDPKGKPSCPAPDKGKNFPFERFLTDIRAWQNGSKPTPPTPGGTLYRVQVGAYSQKTNADATQQKLKTKGYDTYMVQAGGLYKVQVGAYAQKQNADTMAAKLKADGFDTFITTEGGTAVSPGIPTPPVKTITEGSKVKVKPGARTYTGGGVAGFVYGNTYTVDELSGNRAVLDEKGICTPFNVADLILV